MERRFFDASRLEVGKEFDARAERGLAIAGNEYGEFHLHGIQFLHPCDDVFLLHRHPVQLDRIIRRDGDDDALAFLVRAHGVRQIDLQPLVDLPNAAGADEKGERIVITIKADDSIQLNGMEMKKADVIARVKELNAVKMKLPVLISGDRKSSLGTGIELLSELKAAGVEKASFQVSGENR